MTARSPAYPGIGLGQALELAAKLHGKSRTNAIDREAAAKDMGFTGLTGSSTKALADLTHYGLIEKTGKGSIRVSQRAVDILYPESASGKAAAIREAAFAPTLFGALRSHFHDGPPSENALKGYLMRQEFASVAIPYVVTSYLETCRLVEQSAATESHGQAAPSGDNGGGETSDDQRGERHERSTAVPRADRPAPVAAILMSGERELTTGLLSKGAGFRLIVHGKIGEKEIDRLIRKLQLDKEILAETDGDEASGAEDHGS
jgi:hypothetical protein